MKISAEFVRSAASALDLPQDGLAEIALVGRSNVGKSSLINALVRQRVARTSAAAGKTRLANFYRVRRGSGSPFYLVDLPGYGYARGGETSAREFERLAREYFGQKGRERQEGREGPEGQHGPNRHTQRLRPSEREDMRIRARGSASVRGGDGVEPPGNKTALLLVDGRHPGLQSDLEAWSWLRSRLPEASAVVATKIDKLARGERIRALRELESVFELTVLPVSALTGEGLDELWKLIDRLAIPRRAQGRPEHPRETSSSNSNPRRSSPLHRDNTARRATAPLPKKARRPRK